MSEKPYAAAMIKFLDRESGEEKAMTYPITEVSLIEVNPTQKPSDVRAWRKFRVEKQGKWTEVEDKEL